jgi:hypothetical protein
MGIRRIAVLVAAALVGLWLVNRIGAATLADAIARVGPYFALVLALDALSLACDAAVIHTFARRLAAIAYGRVLVAQAIGATVNRVTPGSALGEPVKIAVLTEQLPRKEAIATIVLYNVTTLVVAGATVVIGAPLAIATLDLSPRATAVVLAIAAAIVLVLLAMRALVRRFVLAKLAALETAPARAIAFAIASRALHLTGTLVLIHALGTTITWSLIVAVVSFGTIIRWVSNLVPLGIGVADGGQYELHALFGSSAETGLAFAMADRARTCLLALLGLAIFGLAQIKRVPRSAALAAPFVARRV